MNATAVDTSRSAGVLQLSEVATPLGELLVAVDPHAVRLIEYGGLPRCERQVRRVAGALKVEARPGRTPLHDRIAGEIEGYFAGERTDFTTPIALSGTPFQLHVWEALRTIPFGETRSYAWLAQEVGSPSAIRAVGQANGANPISIVVPCHRVIRTGGALGGYGGGLDRKRSLLELEQRVSGVSLFD